MTYVAPVEQILLAIKTVGMKFSSDLSFEDVQAILGEAGRFAAERIAPLNKVGDAQPSTLRGDVVTTPPGWREAYQDWCSGGWNSLTGPSDYDGQGLPFLLATATGEMWNAASLAFALCPLLTMGAVEAIAHHASDDLKQRYLPKLISGEWSGTMNLTEPQSGSDLSQLRCKAQREGDGSYRITGSKIYITYGEHDCASNIIHLVLARLDDAPAGTKGISLFLVPKFLEDGTRNDLRCQGLEHKIGIHGSPTCSMVYGDRGGATGYLVGEENRGLNCMFTMMNNARVMVGVQGVAVADRATQAAFAYARDRKQGRSLVSGDAQSAIIHHPDVKRMLIDMRAKTAAARLLCLSTAAAIDESHSAASENARSRASARAALLTPLAKGFATDIAVEVASAAVQVHGGAGFVEATGVAQYYRDARILPIYEGTNGIQAIDLVTRKLTLENGATLSDVVQAASKSVAAVLGEAKASALVAGFNHIAQEMCAAPGSTKSLSVATVFARGLATLVAAGLMVDAATMAKGGELAAESEANARYVVTNLLPAAIGALQVTMEGADAVMMADVG